MVETGLRGIREVQAADALQADDVSGHVFCVEGRVSEICSNLKAEQTARTSVEGEVANLQGQLLRMKELGERARRDLEAEQVGRVGVHRCRSSSAR